MALGCRRCVSHAPTAATDCCLLSVLAIALLSLLGGCWRGVSAMTRWLKVNTVKHRTHSLFRQGHLLYEHIPNWPTERLGPLLDEFAAMLAEHQAVQKNVRRPVKI